MNLQTCDKYSKNILTTYPNISRLGSFGIEMLGVLPPLQRYEGNKVNAATSIPLAGCENGAHFRLLTRGFLLLGRLVLSGVNLWVRVWLRAAQTEGGNARGGATKKRQISCTL